MRVIVLILPYQQIFDQTDGTLPLGRRFYLGLVVVVVDRDETLPFVQ
jgi:hypothetical protein